MSERTNISWAEATWNPVTGCTPVSEGCDNCYAKRMALRLWKMGSKKYAYNFRPTPQMDSLMEITHWKQPRRVFVCSMGDLFHDAISFDFIKDVFTAMLLAPQHTYLVLTKRPTRLLDFYRWLIKSTAWGPREASTDPTKPLWPLPNVWLGVTIESQRWARARLEPLVKVPAAHRWISCEPLLEHVDLRDWLENTYGIEWVVVGGETGPGNRYMKHDWARALRVQCDDAAVHFHFKQHSGFHKGDGYELDGRLYRESPPFGD